MKKWFTFILLTVCIVAFSQTTESFKVAYLNKDQIVASLPVIQAINRDLAAMQKQYDEEYRRMQDEYNGKVKRFLDNQDSMQKAIRMARQTEITEYELRLRAYEKKVAEEMSRMRQDAYAPILAKMHQVIKNLAQKMSINIVLDGSTPLYMDENCVDLNTQVYNIMKSKK